MFYTHFLLRSGLQGSNWWISKLWLNYTICVMFNDNILYFQRSGRHPVIWNRWDGIPFWLFCEPDEGSSLKYKTLKSGSGQKIIETNSSRPLSMIWPKAPLLFLDRSALKHLFFQTCPVLSPPVHKPGARWAKGPGSDRQIKANEKHMFHAGTLSDTGSGNSLWNISPCYVSHDLCAKNVNTGGNQQSSPL